MALYEHVFLARQDISGQQVEQLVENLRGILEANGGKVGKVENWGLKTLTYRIKKNRKAYYTLMNIDAPAAAVQEMERQMRFNEDILRYLTIKVEEHDEGQSAMMQKRDDRPRRGGRDDRPGREDRPRRDDDRPRREDDDRPRRPRNEEAA
ncbi:30S ribosomal protein S6 [Aureimonas populi]|uniref:Small ribosomal subunit protein bS6 n=1 Tax=Aureimonas populi TaxID=1701758 RepID=A0ABW5CFN7_9HYPH|nr:30S ribosomal protein S6 [Aureimonas populi]